MAFIDTTLIRYPKTREIILKNTLRTAERLDEIIRKEDKSKQSLVIEYCT
jgi:hypothetical protein